MMCLYWAFGASVEQYLTGALSWGTSMCYPQYLTLCCWNPSFPSSPIFHCSPAPSLLLPQSSLQPALGKQLSWKLPWKTAGAQLISAWCTWHWGNPVTFLLQQCPPSSELPFSSFFLAQIGRSWAYLPIAIPSCRSILLKFFLTTFLTFREEEYPPPPTLYSRPTSSPPPLFLV